MSWLLVMYTRVLLSAEQSSVRWCGAREAAKTVVVVHLITGSWPGMFSGQWLIMAVHAAAAMLPAELAKMSMQLEPLWVRYIAIEISVAES